MFSFIKGEVISAQFGTVVLECNGVGFEFSVSNSTLVKVNAGGTTAKLYTYLQVREDGMTLYGFYSTEEKGLFLKLISVSGIGPKAAMGILGGMEFAALATAIVTKDAKALSKVKGVGKKTAERIVLELGESLAKEISLEEITQIVGETPDDDIADAVYALRSLGIGQQEAVVAVKRAKPMAKSLEELIAYALKYI